MLTKPKYIPLSKELVTDLILDIFFDAMDEGIEEISTNEIMEFLGVSKDELSDTNILYDLKKIIPHKTAPDVEEGEPASQTYAIFMEKINT